MVGVQGALPVRLTRCFGREAEIAELVEVLDHARLVTLVGAPGCGKTRLAVELIEQLMSTPLPKFWFVDLASVADPLTVPNAVASAGGVREQHGRPMEDVLVDHLLGTGPVLLVFDNCEHVLDDAARLAERLVVSDPLVRVLATSRVSLSIRGEQVWQVRPLDAATAVELFVDRARLACSDFCAAADDEPVVSEICRGLDGLPLAIELVAAWTRVLSLVDIAERVRDALPLLQTSLRGVDPRHRTMQASVEWSSRLLGPEDRQLFTRLAVFVGGFDLDAAVAVAGSDDDVLAGLARLVDASLVQATSTADGAAIGFRLLEPIRQCALAMLKSTGEGEDLQRRHGEHFLALARAGEPRWYRDARPMTAFAYFQEHSENFHAAFMWAGRQPGDLGLQFCEALAPLWEIGGRVNDGRRWLEQHLAAGSSDARLRVSTSVWASRLAMRQGDYPSARRWLDRCKPYLPELTSWWRALVATQHGWTAMSDGELVVAAERCERALELSKDTGDTTGQARALGVLAMTRLLAGDLAEAKRMSSEADALATSEGNLTVAAHVRLGQCYCAFLEGDSVQLRSRTLAMLEAIDAGGFLEEIDILAVCSVLAVAEGRFEAAGRLHGAVFARGERRGNQPARAGISTIMPLAERMVGGMDPAAKERVMAEGARLSLEELRSEALAEPERDPILTPREREVAALVTAGMNNRQIGERLYISRRTVETHVENIRRKLGLASRHEIRMPNP